MSSETHHDTPDEQNASDTVESLFIPSPEIDESVYTEDDEYVYRDTLTRFVVFDMFGAAVEYRAARLELYRHRDTGNMFIHFTGDLEWNKTVFDDELLERVFVNDTYSGPCYVMEYDGETYESITSLIYQYPDAVFTFGFLSPEEAIHERLADQGDVENVPSITDRNNNEHEHETDDETDEPQS